MAGADYAMGHQGKLVIDGAEVCFASISVTENGTDVDVSCSGENGKYRLTANGLQQLEISFTLNFNASENPYSDPPDLPFGSVVGNVYYYPDRADTTQFWYAAVMKVAGGTNLNNTLDSAQPMSFKLLSDGVYVNPVG